MEMSNTYRILSAETAWYQEQSVNDQMVFCAHIHHDFWSSGMCTGQKTDKCHHTANPHHGGKQVQYLQHSGRVGMT